MAHERDRAAKVIRQTGNQVEVEHQGSRLTVPMKGFPPGFSLTAGARVILLDDESGTVAKPLVRAVTSQGASPSAMQPSTVIDERHEEAAAPGATTVWVVENADPNAAEQAIAVRRG